MPMESGYLPGTLSTKRDTKDEAICVYCDESCHLENDGAKAMALGAIWLRRDEVKKVNQRIREIKASHGIKAEAEVKWTKASPSNLELYMDLIDYFFDDDDIHFRGLIAPDKSILDHERFNQTHEDWYYKVYFDMLKTIFRHDLQYFVYVDIMNTDSGRRVDKLHEVCSNNVYDFNHDIIRRIQPIRSHEVQIMQLVDIITGALAYRHNHADSSVHRNSTKVAIVNRIISRSGASLVKSTLLSDQKFNLLVWRPYGAGE